MNTNLQKISCSLALLGAVATVSAQSNITVAATSRGFYTTSSYTSGSTANYLAGSSGAYNDWFLFDLSGISPGTIASAQLELLNPGTSYSITEQGGHYYPDYDGAAGSGTYSLWDVSTSAISLENGTTPATTFADLGSGVSYGSQTYSTADNGTFFTISLDSAFISDAQSDLGSGDIAVGGSLTGSGNLFGYSGAISAADTFLVLNIVPAPEPSTLALVALGGASLLFYRRRK